MPRLLQQHSWYTLTTKNDPLGLSLQWSLFHFMSLAVSTCEWLLPGAPTGIPRSFVRDRKLLFLLSLHTEVSRTVLGSLHSFIVDKILLENGTHNMWKRVASTVSVARVSWHPGIFKNSRSSALFQREPGPLFFYGINLQRNMNANILLSVKLLSGSRKSLEQREDPGGEPGTM